MQKTAIILLLISSCLCHSQNESITKNPTNTEIQRKNYAINPDAALLNTERIYTDIGFEKSVHFPGGFDELKAFIKKNFISPKELLDENNKIKKGMIFAEIVIEKDGSLSNIKISRDIGFGSAEEVIRVLKLSPKWIPAEHKGKLLRIRMRFPIRTSEL